MNTLSIREALENCDLERLKTLLPTIDKNELKTELIRSTITYNTSQEVEINLPGSETIFEKLLRSSPEFAFKVLFLLSPTDRSEIFYRFRWEKVFDFVERKNNTTANNKLRTKLTVKQFVEKIRRIFPEIKPEEVDLYSFLSAKHFRTALKFGAPYDNNEFFVTNLKYPWRVNKRYSHVELCEWLIRQKFMTKSPFSVEELAFQLLHGNKKLVDLILKEFPSCIEEIDEKGKNILYYCSVCTGIFRFKLLFPLLARLRKLLPQQKLIEMFVQRRQGDEVPALRYCSFAFPDTREIPIELILALIELVKTRHEKDTTTLMNIAKQVPPRRKPMGLWILLRQHGLTADELTDYEPILKLVGKDAKIGSVSNEFYKPEAEKLEKVVEADPSQPPYIFSLPEELLLLIAAQLSPHDVLDYLTSCKRLVTCLKRGNENYWKNYNQLHLFPSKFQGSEKKRFIIETRGVLNWQSNICHKITLPGPSVPHLMDENWIYFAENNSAVQFWSCHSQRIESDIRFPRENMKYYQPMALMQNYNENEIPGAIVSHDPWNQKKYALFRGETFHELKKLAEIYATAGGQLNSDSIVPIDHRVLYSKRATLYDVETDTIVQELPNIQNLWLRSFGYNPYGGTIVTTGLNQVSIYDLDYKLVQCFDTGHINGHADLVQMIDEFTVLVAFQRPPADCHIYDLRMEKCLFIAKNFYYHGDTVLSSPQRVLLRSAKAPVVTSWHLPTRQIEWAELTEQYPRLINSRYWVNFFGGKTEIRDHCSNSISYQ